MKRFVKNLYWRATNREYNRGVDAGRWVIASRLADIIAISATRDELIEQLSGIIYREELYRNNPEMKQPSKAIKQIEREKRNA